MTSEINDAAIDTLLATGRAMGAMHDHPQGGKVVVVPEGYETQRLEPLAAKLHHVKQRVAVLNHASFAAYLNRFKTTETQIFADYRRPVIVGVVDYHGPDGVEAVPTPDYCDHRVTFEPPWSEEWARWRQIDGKGMSQGEFAEFLEENYMDVAEPPAAELLDVVGHLQAKRNVDFKSGIRLQDGTTQLTYEESIEAKGKGTLKVPAEFSLGLPIFYGGERYKVRVLLRYRIKEGILVFIAKINRREFVEQTAFNDIVTEIETATGIAPYAGSLGA